MIERTEAGGITTLRLAHGKASAMDLELLRALAAALEAVERSEARALVLTGTGGIFSAGVDLFRLLEGGRAYLREFIPALSRTLLALFGFPKPAVAAVNGHAIAGGCILACACDYRLMARGGGRIGVPELRVGVPFPLVPLEVMRAALPAPLLDEAVYIGRSYEPEAALARGLVHELAESAELLSRANEVARQMAALPPESYRRTKRAMRGERLADLSRRAPVDDAEIVEAWASAPVQAAIRDYVERTLKR